MTEKEFTDWRNYHASMFPRFAEWMLGMSGGESEPQEIVDLREQAFLKAFANYTGDDLKAASFVLWKMPPDERPRGYGDHAAALLEILRRPRESSSRWRREPDCQVCNDSGLVTVTAVPGTAIFSDAGIPMPNGVWCAVDCSCEKACCYSDDYKGPRRDRYDRNRHQRWEPDLSDVEDRVSELSARGARGAALAVVLRRFGNLGG